MEKSFLLDRSCVIDGLDDNTPKCVLVDIADGNGFMGASKYSHSILMENLKKPNLYISKIEGIILEEISSIDIEFFRPYVSIIARYVNPDKSIGWSFRTLIKAFRHMLFFDISQVGDKIGPITPENLNSFNACMLYKLCKKYKISLRPTTSIEQMHSGVLMLKDYLSDNLIIPKNMSVELYISIMMESSSGCVKLQKYSPVENGSFESLRKFYDDISVPEKLYSRIEPRSHDEAVIIAALEFKIDISSSSKPLRELIKLQESKTYIPADSGLKQRYERNPKWFSLKKNYSPNLAMVFDNESLSNFVKVEALEEDEVSTSLPPQSRERREILKNMLFQARISQTFYHGWHPDASNYITPIEMDDMREPNYDTDSTVSFGSVEYSDLITFKTSELGDFFKARGAFVNPLKVGENFNSTAIKKLKIICKTIKTVDRKKRSTVYTEEQRLCFSSLLNIIEKVESTMLKLSSDAEKFKEMYEASSYKEEIRNVFTKLMDAGMYMRGWKVSCPEDKLPLQSVDTVTSCLDEVSDYTNFGLVEFRDSLDKLEVGISSQIKRLPLVYVQYNIDEKKPDFLQSMSTDDGLTIWDRFLIVKEGEKSRKTSACIRMTSNWFVSSAYYYMTAIGMERNFDICHMSKIS
jgi:hypothetical protein